MDSISYIYYCLIESIFLNHSLLYDVRLYIIIKFNHDWFIINYLFEISFNSAISNSTVPIPVAARSEREVTLARLLGLLVRITHPLCDMDVCLFEYYVLSDRGLCDGLVTSLEESCRVWCVQQIVISKPHSGWGQGSIGLLSHKKRILLCSIFCVLPTSRLWAG